MREVGALSVGAFSSEIDSRLESGGCAGIVATTVQDKRWYAYYDGRRNLKPGSVSFRILGQALPGFEDFFLNGPEGLWRGLFNDPKNLWGSLRFRFEGVDRGQVWREWTDEEVLRYRASELSLSEFLRRTKRIPYIPDHLYLSPDCFPLNCYGHLTDAISVYRICSELRKFTNLDINDQDLFDSVEFMLRLLRADLEQLGIYEDIYSHLMAIEAERLSVTTLQ